MSVVGQPHAYHQRAQCLFNWPKAPQIRVPPLQFQILATHSRRQFRSRRTLADRNDGKVSSEGTPPEAYHDELANPTPGADKAGPRIVRTWNPERQDAKDKGFQEDLRQMMRSVPQSVVIVTSAPSRTDAQEDVGGQLRGATLSSFTVVSMHGPPVVSLNLKKFSSVFEAIKTRRMADKISRRFFIHFPHRTTEAATLLNNFASGKGECEVRLPENAPTSGSSTGSNESLVNRYPIVGSQNENVIYGSIACKYLEHLTVSVRDHVVIFGSVCESFLPEKSDPQAGGLSYLEGKYWDSRTGSSVSVRQEPMSGAISDRLVFGTEPQHSLGSANEDGLDTTSKERKLAYRTSQKATLNDSSTDNAKPHVKAPIMAELVKRGLVGYQSERVARKDSEEHSRDASCERSFGDTYPREGDEARVQVSQFKGEDANLDHGHNLPSLGQRLDAFTSDFFAPSLISPRKSANSESSDQNTPSPSVESIKRSKSTIIQDKENLLSPSSVSARDVAGNEAIKLHPGEVTVESKLKENSNDRAMMFDLQGTTMRPAAKENDENEAADLVIRKTSTLSPRFYRPHREFFSMTPSVVTKLWDILAEAPKDKEVQNSTTKQSNNQVDSPEEGLRVSKSPTSGILPGIDGKSRPHSPDQDNTQLRSEKSPATPTSFHEPVDRDLIMFLDRLARQAKERMVKERAKPEQR